MFVGLKLGSDFDCLSSVCIEFEGRIECCSQCLSKQRGNSFAISFSERKNGLAHTVLVITDVREVSTINVKM